MITLGEVSRVIPGVPGILGFVLGLLGAFPLYADWGTTATASARVIASDTAQAYPLAVSDKRHGALVVWVHRFDDVRAQRIDQYGNEAWTPGGVTLCGAPKAQFPQAVISDGAGGAFTVWRDFRDFIGNYHVETSTNALYVQHVDSSGHVQWTPDGVKIQTLNQDTSESRTEYNPTWNEQLVRDDGGGVYAFWESSRPDSVGNYHPAIYAQHITAQGEKRWGAEGRKMYDFTSPLLSLPDGAHGFYLFSGGVRGSRFSAEGTPVWDSLLTIHPSAGFDAHIIPDGAGGFIWAGFHLANDDYVGLQHINGNGAKLWGEGVNYYPGHEVLDYSLNVVDDSQGGAFVSWQLKYSYRLETMHFDRYGQSTWSSISPTYAKAGDAEGGYYYTYSTHSGRDIGWIVRLDSLGQPYWAHDSLAYYRRNDIHYGYGRGQFVPDGRHGVMVFWNEVDSASGVLSVMGQLINAEGQLGRVIVKTDEETDAIPKYDTLGNYPNPFNPSTTIVYALPDAQQVRIDVYDMRGNHIHTLVNKVIPAGYHATIWDGTNQSGETVASGVYFYRIISRDTQLTRKMLLIR